MVAKANNKDDSLFYRKSVKRKKNVQKEEKIERRIERLPIGMGLKSTTCK